MPRSTSKFSKAQIQSVIDEIFPVAYKAFTKYICLSWDTFSEAPPGTQAWLKAIAIWHLEQMSKKKS